MIGINEQSVAELFSPTIVNVGAERNNMYRQCETQMNTMNDFTPIVFTAAMKPNENSMNVNNNHQSIIYYHYYMNRNQVACLTLCAKQLQTINNNEKNNFKIVTHKEAFMHYKLCPHCASSIPPDNPVFSPLTPAIYHLYSKQKECIFAIYVYKLITMEEATKWRLQRCCKCHSSLLANPYVYADSSEMPNPTRLHIYDNTPGQCNVEKFALYSKQDAHLNNKHFCAWCIRRFMSTYLKKKNSTDEGRENVK